MTLTNAGYGDVIFQKVLMAPSMVVEFQAEVVQRHFNPADALENRLSIVSAIRPINRFCSGLVEG
jgi:hypothetical protein